MAELKNIPLHGKIIKGDDGWPYSVYVNPRPVKTGSLILITEHEGEKYVAMLRRGDVMTFIGRTRKMPYPDADTHDIVKSEFDTAETAVNHARETTGIELSDSQLKSLGVFNHNAEPDKYRNDVPKRGFEKDWQDNDVYMALIKGLPELNKGAVWVRISDIEKQTTRDDDGSEIGNKYIYKGDNPDVKKGEELASTGGFYWLEKALAEVEAQKYKGIFTGPGGLIKAAVSELLDLNYTQRKKLGNIMNTYENILNKDFNPRTWVGKRAQEFSRAVEKEFLQLMKEKEPAIGF